MAPAVFLYTGICFSLNFPGVTFRKQPHRWLPSGCNCTRFLSRYFCQAENPQTNGLVGRSQAGLGDCSVCWPSWECQRQEGKRERWESLQLLIHWGKSELESFLHAKPNFLLNSKRKSCILHLVKKSKGLKFPKARWLPRKGTACPYRAGVVCTGNMDPHFLHPSRVLASG